MSRWAFIMSKAQRARVVAWVQRAPDGFRIEIKEPQRSTDQNAKMWACLTDISVQAKHHGLTLSPEDWKVLFVSALKQESRVVPNLESTGLVTLGTSSSDLSKSEFSDLIELMHAYAAQNGVVLHDAEVTA